MAQAELERLRSGYEEERRKRESELRERHQVVQLRKQIKLQADRCSHVLAEMSSNLCAKRTQPGC